MNLGFDEIKAEVSRHNSQGEFELRDTEIGPPPFEADAIHGTEDVEDDVDSGEEPGATEGIVRTDGMKGETGRTVDWNALLMF